jgi:membrane-bound ClpP family serine protease
VSGHPAPTAAAEHEPHLPAPSLSPAIIGLGVTFMSFGILFGVVLIVVGAVILVIGMATWLIDDARAYVAAGDRDAGHGGH